MRWYFSSIGKVDLPVIEDDGMSLSKDLSNGQCDDGEESLEEHSVE